MPNVTELYKQNEGNRILEVAYGSLEDVTEESLREGLIKPRIVEEVMSGSGDFQEMNSLDDAVSNLRIPIEFSRKKQDLFETAVLSVLEDGDEDVYEEEIRDVAKNACVGFGTKQNYVDKGKRWVRENFWKHVSDCTALCALNHPLLAISEVTWNGMSDKVSMNARLLGTGLAFGGMGSIMARCRDYSRKVFNVTDKEEDVITKHDKYFLAGWNLTTTPGFYFLAGSRDLDELVKASIFVTVYGAVTGDWWGYATDVFRDLIGVEECERTSYPDLIRKQSPLVKKGIAVGLGATSVGLLGLIYSITPEAKDIFSGFWK
ncbi:hypothetical protein CL618_03255 [archaeon]|nr:hypothetical protein [archaeon]|tara:strand:- start:1698 stop:2651 length:954 start_codon:yes stop_codon:yes gene_type:complete